jgi:5-oxopent-3-ene-1,2,5-tricarboxylate decarboxylase/2-hydroxyhepta-2,4-diene-1,7-dioate isomerase
LKSFLSGSGRGAVYAAALNFKGVLEHLGTKAYEEPHKAPPQHPVLYIKTPNTWCSSGDVIRAPTGVSHLKMGGTLGIVIGRAACRVTEATALDYVGGWVATNDVSIPHESYFRPAIKERCRDTFLAMGEICDAATLRNPDATQIRIFLNGTLKATVSLGDLIRPVCRLIQDVTEFLTLQSGDVLLVGESERSPLASAGDRVRVEIDGLDAVENALEAE